MREMYSPDLDLDRDEIDREKEKLQRRKKLQRRGDESDIETPKRPGRLEPYSKKARQLNWRSLLEEEEEEEENEDGSTDDSTDE